MDFTEEQSMLNIYTEIKQYFYSTSQKQCLAPSHISPMGYSVGISLRGSCTLSERNSNVDTAPIHALIFN